MALTYNAYTQRKNLINVQNNQWRKLNLILTALL